MKRVRANNADVDVGAIHTGMAFAFPVLSLFALLMWDFASLPLPPFLFISFGRVISASVAKVSVRGTMRQWNTLYFHFIMMSLFYLVLCYNYAHWLDSPHIWRDESLEGDVSFSFKVSVETTLTDKTIDKIAFQVLHYIVYPAGLARTLLPNWVSKHRRRASSWSFFVLIYSTPLLYKKPIWHFKRNGY